MASLLASAAIAAGLLFPDAGSMAAQRPEQTEEGHDIYMRDCAWCHGPDAKGSNFGPTLEGVGPAAVDFMLSTGRMPVDQPVQVATRKPPRYDGDEIDAIVAFVASIVPGGPPIPEVDPERGNLGHGADLFLLNCAACHSATATGSALTSGLVSPSLEQATPTQVAEALTVGPTSMPKFVPAFDRHDVNSVVRYVQYLHRPDDRGGEPLLHLGPVAEGFVAWIVGMGLLLLAIRWIGTTMRQEESAAESGEPRP